MTIKKVVAGMVFVAAAFLSGCSNALGGNMENSGTADITVACRGTDIGSGAGYTVTVTLFDASDNSVVGTSAGTFSDGTGTLNCSFEKIKYGTAVYASVIESISVIVDTNVTVDIVAAGRSGIVPVKAKTVLDIALKKFNPSTTFFVAGTNPLLITSAGNDDNSGTFNAPFATLGKALNAVNTANDGSSSYTIFVDGTVNKRWADAQTNQYGLGYIMPAQTLNLTIQSLYAAATLDVSAYTGMPVLMIVPGQDGTTSITLSGLKLTGGSKVQGSDNPGSAISCSGMKGTLTLDSCTIQNCSTDTAMINAGAAAVSLKSSTLAAPSANRIAVMTGDSVTLSDSSVNITGIVKAAGICVNAVPQKAITVEPYVTTTSAAFGDFLVPGDSVTLDTADFPLSDTDDYYYYKNGNYVYGVMPVQELTYSGNSSGCITSSITYAGFSQNVVTSADNIGSTNFATTVDSRGQIYVMYIGYNNGMAYCKLYTAGSSVDAGITALSSNTYNAKLCVYNGTLFASFTNSDGTASSLYSADLSGGTCELAAVTDGIISNAVTSMAVTEYNGKMYVLYSYTDKSTGKYNPVLGIASLTLSDSVYTLVAAKYASVYSSSLSSADTSSFRGNVKISDMFVSDVSGTKMLYLLLSDTLTYGGQVNSSHPLDSRGAFITVNADEAAASLLAGNLPAFNHVYGWISASQETVYSSAGSMDCFAAVAKNYADGYFAGPDRFVGLTPKKITMADYGIYVAAAGSSGTAGKVNIKNGTAVFDLSSVEFTPSENDECLYGYIGSITENTAGFEISAIFTDY